MTLALVFNAVPVSVYADPADDTEIVLDDASGQEEIEEAAVDETEAAEVTEAEESEADESEAEETEAEETEAETEAPSAEETEAGTEETEARTEAESEIPAAEETEAGSEAPEVQETEAGSSEAETGGEPASSEEETEARTEEEESASEAESLPESGAVSETEPESVPGTDAETISESAAETTPESVSETVPETIAETIAETIPETLPLETEALLPAGAGAANTALPAGAIEPTAAPLAVQAPLPEITYPEFNASKTIDGIEISLYAEEGVFPAGSRLSVRKVSSAAKKQAEEAIDEVREEGKQVAVSYTFDIKVLDKDGEAIQPGDAGKVKVSFRLRETENENLEGQIYHHAEDGTAEALTTETEVQTNEKTEKEETLLAAETASFSLYTVEFTYNELRYVLQGGESIALSEILDALGLTGEVTAVMVSNESLFSAAKEDGVWTIKSHKAFLTEEWMKVVIGGIEYLIKVTDDPADCVTNLSIGTVYTSIAAALAELTAGDEAVLEVKGSFSESVSLNKNVTATLLAADSGATINGAVNVSAGCLNLQGLTINGGVKYTKTGTTGAIDDCDITYMSGHGVEISYGAQLDHISGGSIAAYQSGVLLRGSSGTETVLGTISSVKITTTGSGDFGSGVYLEHGGSGSNGVVRIDLISDCEVETKSANVNKAGIQAANWVGYTPEDTSIGVIRDTRISCPNGASGIFLQLAVIGSIEDTDIVVKDANGIYLAGPVGALQCRIDSISGGSIKDEGTRGNGIYSLARPKEDGYGIHEIRDISIDAGGKGIYNTGYIGSILGSSGKMKISSSNTSTAVGSSYQYAAIWNSGTIDTIDNAELTAGARGIFTSANGEIGEILNSVINADYQGIYLLSSTPRIGTISSTAITAKNHYGIYSQGSIGTIGNGSKIETKSANGIAVYNASAAKIDTIENSEIIGYAGIYNYATSAASAAEITNILNNKISSTGVGIQISGGKAELIDGNEITGLNGIVILNYARGAVDQDGVVGKISGGSIKASQNGISVRTNASVGEVDGVSIQAEAAGIDTRADGSIGMLSGNQVTAGTNAVSIAAGSEVDSITSGTYVGDQNGVLIQGGLGQITGDPVFWGKSGYAIDNTSEEAVVSIEPGISSALQGNARYKGASDDPIAVPTADTYPVFNGGIVYKMSKKTASVSGLGDGFHYLAVRVKISYDANGGLGDMSGKTYDDEWHAGLKAEENGFTKDHYRFKAWNTRENGSGKSYAPGAFLDIEEKETVLYAQWTPILHELSISKKTAGNLSSAEKYFKFDLRFEKLSEGAEVETALPAVPAEWEADTEQPNQDTAYTKGEIYQHNSVAQYAADAAGRVSLSLYLKDGQSAVIKGIPDGSAYEVREDSESYTPLAEASGDTHTGEGTADETELSSASPVRDTALLAVTKLEFTNTLTGILYDANGGTGEMEPTVIRNGEATELRPNSFAREGYTFKAWNTAADGSGTEYADAQTLAAGELADGGTLYAQWEKKEDPVTPVYYTLSFDANGGTFTGNYASDTAGAAGSIYRMRAEAGSQITIIEAPTRAGHTFLYWKGSEYQPGDLYTVSEDHSFTAQWEKKQEETTGPEETTAPEETTPAETTPAETTPAETTGSSGGGGGGGGTGRKGYTDPTVPETLPASTEAETQAPVIVPAAVIPQAPAPATLPTHTEPASPETTAAETIAETAAETTEAVAEPQAERDDETIRESEVPQAGLKMGPAEEGRRSWALLNLLLTVLTAIVAIALLDGYRKGSKEEKQTEEPEEEGAEAEDEEKRRKKAKLLGVNPAAAAILLFIFTQDMTARMVLMDRWTLLTAVFAGINILLAYMTREKEKEASPEEQEA